MEDLDYREGLIAMIAERLEDLSTEGIEEIYEHFCTQTVH